MQLLDQSIQIKSLISSYYLPKGHRTSGHRNRATHGLTYNCSGEKIYIFENGPQLTVPADCIIYLPQDATYTVRTTGPGDALVINFELIQQDDFEPFSFSPKQSDKYISIFRKSESTWRTKHIGYYECCCEQLYRLLYRIKSDLNAPYLSSNHLAQLEPALAYINEHYTMESIEISHLASLCKISEVYLRKLFHSAVHQSPLQYIHSIKITRAKELLLSGEYNVSETAELCGYTDVSHFSRTFKKLTGLSPSKFSNS